MGFRLYDLRNSDRQTSLVGSKMCRRIKTKNEKRRVANDTYRPEPSNERLCVVMFIARQKLEATGERLIETLVYYVDLIIIQI